MGFRSRTLDVPEGGGGYQLGERSVRYKALFEAEKADIGLENTYLWNVRAE
jgi:hypothetical protein